MHPALRPFQSFHRRASARNVILLVAAVANDLIAEVFEFLCRSPLGLQPADMSDSLTPPLLVVSQNRLFRNPLG